MHDVADLGDRGVVTVGVVSDAFVDAAEIQNRSLAFEPSLVFIPHPIQDRSDAELTELAETRIDAILGGLCTDIE